MQINCLHGYFMFRETTPGEVSKFISYFEGLTLTTQDDYFTFTALAGAPSYAISGGTYLGASVTKTTAGRPWEIFKDNNLVYNFQTGKVVPVTTITTRVELIPALNCYLSPGLILPGSIRTDGTRVTNYAAWYSFTGQTFKYSEVG